VSEIAQFKHRLFNQCSTIVDEAHSTMMSRFLLSYTAYVLCHIGGSISSYQMA